MSQNLTDVYLKEVERVISNVIYAAQGDIDEVNIQREALAAQRKKPARRLSGEGTELKKEELQRFHDLIKEIKIKMIGQIKEVIGQIGVY